MLFCWSGFENACAGTGADIIGILTAMDSISGYRIAWRLSIAIATCTPTCNYFYSIYCDDMVVKMLG